MAENIIKWYHYFYLLGHQSFDVLKGKIEWIDRKGLPAILFSFLDCVVVLENAVVHVMVERTKWTAIFVHSWSL